MAPGFRVNSRKSRRKGGNRRLSCFAEHQPNVSITKFDEVEARCAIIILAIAVQDLKSTRVLTFPLVFPTVNSATAVLKMQHSRVQLLAAYLIAVRVGKISLLIEEKSRREDEGRWCVPPVYGDGTDRDEIIVFYQG